MIDHPDKHKAFLASSRKHILMITNHGIHEWNIVPGLPDTGGQDIFVNQLSDTLTKFDFKVTIANRGGYRHPTTGEMRMGMRYKDENQRILFLEDGQNDFIRKEDMNEHLPALANFLKRCLDSEKNSPQFIISHYWDGAKLGILFNRNLPEKVKHIWVPHSLGMLKKTNVSPDKWPSLRIDERIEEEKKLFPELHSIAATSAKIKETLKTGYGHDAKLFLPPCIDTDRFHPAELEQNHPLWEFLSRYCGLPAQEVRNCRIITEISRTDTTKRKNVLIEAFALVAQEFKDLLLVVTIDENEQKIAEELRQLILARSLEHRVAVVGSIWELLPSLYAATTIYCSPSVMEDFGMAVQEAAASQTAIITSHLVPFALEYLLGKAVKEIRVQGGCGQPMKVGEGVVVVHADDVAGFAAALGMILSDPALAKRLAERAYQITVPYFTWRNMVKMLIEEIGT